jgi:hypothetical protein
VHFGDLVGRSSGVLALQGRQRGVGLAAPAERVICERQCREPPDLVGFLLNLVGSSVIDHPVNLAGSFRVLKCAVVSRFRIRSAAAILKTELW